MAPLVGSWLLSCRQVLDIEPLPGLTAAAEAGHGDAQSDARDERDVVGMDSARDAPFDAGPGFCKTLSAPAPGTQVVCTDFDEDASFFELGWDNDDQHPDPGDVNGGSLGLYTRVYRSYPRSLLAVTPANVSSTAVIGAFLLKTIPGNGPSAVGSLVLEMDVYVGTLDVPSSGFVILVGLDYEVGGIALTLDQSGLNLEVDGAAFGTPPKSRQTVVSPFPTGTWEHVGLIVANSPVDGGPDGLTSVSCAGMSAEASVPAAFQSVAPGKLFVTVGPTSVGPIGAFSANLDNITLTWGRPFSRLPP